MALDHGCIDPTQTDRRNNGENGGDLPGARDTDLWNANSTDALSPCYFHISTEGNPAMGIIWTIIIGFVAGVIAKLVMPGDNEPSGFILTTILGVVGAIVATYLGQSLGWYASGEGAGIIGAAVGAIIVLAIWGFMRKRA